MSDERERALDTWLSEREYTKPEKHAFRAGYDARGPELDRLRAELAASQERVRELQSTCVERMLERDARIVELESEHDVWQRAADGYLTRAETAERELAEMTRSRGLEINARQAQAYRADCLETDLAEARKVTEAVREKLDKLSREERPKARRFWLFGLNAAQAKDVVQNVDAGWLRSLSERIAELRALLAPPTTDPVRGSPKQRKRIKDMLAEIEADDAPPTTEGE